MLKVPFMSKKKTNSPSISWIKIGLIIGAIGLLKIGYDELASEGNPLITLMFKVRAPYLNPDYLRKVKPTSFRMTNHDQTDHVDVGGQSFAVEYSYRYPQVEYYGEVLGRSDLNKQLYADFESVERRVLDAFKIDTQAHIDAKELIPGFGKQPAKLTLSGEVSYFSGSIISVRYDAQWSYGGRKELYPRRAVYGVAIDISTGKVLTLRDVVGYPYSEFAVRVWDKARIGIVEQHLDINQFKLYSDEPEFYISPASLILVQLSNRIEQASVEVRIPFRDNRALFRSDGPIGRVSNPTDERTHAQ